VAKKGEYFSKTFYKNIATCVCILVHQYVWFKWRLILGISWRAKSD